LITIEDPRDPRVAAFGRTDRQLRRDGLFLAEGDLVVERAIAAGCRPVAALVDPERVPPVTERLDTAVFAAGPAIRRAVTHLGVAQAIVALFERPEATPPAQLLERAERLVVVEALDNPANVGAIVRSAAALGWDGALLDRESADPLARRSLRVAMGTAFALAHARVDDVVATVSELARLGVVAYGLTPDPAARDIDTVEPPARCAVVIGSERAGLSAAVRDACAEQVQIPLTAGVDSLNAAAAAAIACHVLRRSASWSA
jgi:tRNA G18 (ribose-2'-O)-methylase SpoU